MTQPEILHQIARQLENISFGIYILIFLMLWALVILAWGTIK